MRPSTTPNRFGQENPKWLTPESLSHEALKTVVLDRSLLKALPQMTGFYHTGELEVFHSVLLKYCEKRSHFSYEGMLARTKLAALDHNHNLGRIQAKTLSGVARYKVVYPKSGKDWVAKPIREAKSYNYLDHMMDRVISLRCSQFTT